MGAKAVGGATDRRLHLLVEARFGRPQRPHLRRHGRRLLAHVHKGGVLGGDCGRHRGRLFFGAPRGGHGGVLVAPQVGQAAVALGACVAEPPLRRTAFQLSRRLPHITTGHRRGWTTRRQHARRDQ